MVISIELCCNAVAFSRHKNKDITIISSLYTCLEKCNRKYKRMKRLSVEVISIIFKYLHLKQKLECMLVCKRWANILRSGLDIETVIIVNRKNVFISLMEKIKVLDDYGRHCRRLMINEPIPHIFDYEALARHFPNLTYLVLNGDDQTESSHLQQKSLIKAEQRQQQQQKPWRIHLKVAKILKYNWRFLYFLDAGVFHSLETLVLSPCNEFSYQFMTSIFGKLKNAPNIKTLSIERLHVDVCDLEELHKSLPKLISLTLKKCFLHCERSVPVHVQPIHTLKTLQILDFYPSFDVETSIPRYLIFKYSRIEKLVMKTPMYSEGKFSQLAHNATCFIRAIGRHLTSLELHLAFKTPTVFDILDNKVRLEHLTARIFLSNRLFNKLVSFNGMQNVKTLKLTHVPHIDFGVFKRFSMLTELELEFKEKRGTKFRVELDIILNRDLPKNLESLGLGYIELDINPNNNHHDSNDMPILKQLKLNRSEVSETLPIYIDQRMKMLRNLLLYDCKMGLPSSSSSSSSSCFELPAHRLNLVHILLSTELSYSATGHPYEENYENPVNLKLEIGGSCTRYYRPPENRCRNRNGLSLNVNTSHDHPLHTICEPEPFNENKKYFYFKCKDVQTIYFNRYLIL
ncbi:hypothetical protein K501DRAFT_278202 [Backusella circina FSU 941]|nr:hypothetical protein K501DRAFT_278202 [Backusella circina FSU 941]